MKGKVHYRRKHRAARAKYERRTAAAKKSLDSVPVAESELAATATGNTPAISSGSKSPASASASETFAAPDVKHQLESAIDCYFCGMRADVEHPPENGGFDSFEKLAAHTLACPWAPLPKPRSEFHIEAAKLLAANRIADARMKGETSMTLPAPKATAQQGGGGAGLPYLKVEHVTAEPTEVLVTGVDAKPSGFNDITLKLKMNGTAYFWGLKASNPCYGVLFDKLGADESKWIGRQFTVLQEWNTFYEKNFIGIGKVLPEARAEKGKK